MPADEMDRLLRRYHNDPSEFDLVSPERHRRSGGRGVRAAVIVVVTAAAAAASWLVASGLGGSPAVPGA